MGMKMSRRPLSLEARKHMYDQVMRRAAQIAIEQLTAEREAEPDAQALERVPDHDPQDVEGGQDEDREQDIDRVTQNTRL